MSGQKITIDFLRKFRFEKVLNDDPLVHSLVLLGTLPASDDSSTYLPAIISIQRRHFPLDSAGVIVRDLVEQVEPIEANDIYHWFIGWLGRHPDFPDVRINVIFPATEVHILKYSRQRVIMVKETANLYETVVEPYIRSFPPSRFEWVYNILSHKAEAHKLLYEDPDPATGFVLMPDMKWDLETISSLYLLAIAHSRTIRTLRDLKREHIPMLQAIRREAGKVVRDRWGLDGEKSLRCYIHYQPSYYHFHVHIVNANYTGFKGICVGQAHLLEDVISLLELSPPTGPTLLAQMTLTYELGEQHGLFGPMLAFQDAVNARDGNL